MPWTITESSAFTKQYGKTTLTQSEQTKYEKWRDDAEEHGPLGAAEFNGMRVEKMKGADNQWELYIGQAKRISFTYTDGANAKTVTLLFVGHTATKK
jgi:hypothetical protein